MQRARDQLARRAETSHPGWQVSHGLHGWTAVRDRDTTTLRSTSLPGLTALITSADASSPARPAPPAPPP
jgi:hypothetical protein